MKQLKKTIIINSFRYPKLTYIDKQDMRHGEKVKMCPFCEKYRIMDLIGYFIVEGKEEPVENKDKDTNNTTEPESNAQ